MTQLVAFSALHAAAWALWLPAVWSLRNAKGRRRITELHHFWAGLALVVLGFALHSHALAWVGLSMMLDDGGQHAAQRWLGVRSEVEGGPVWPWHRVYRVARNAVAGVLLWLGATRVLAVLERRAGL